MNEQRENKVSVNEQAAASGIKLKNADPLSASAYVTIALDGSAAKKPVPNQTTEEPVEDSGKDKDKQESDAVQEDSAQGKSGKSGNKKRNQKSSPTQRAKQKKAAAEAVAAKEAEAAANAETESKAESEEAENTKAPEGRSEQVSKTEDMLVMPTFNDPALRVIIENEPPKPKPGKPDKMEQAIHASIAQQQSANIDAHHMNPMERFAAQFPAIPDGLIFKVDDPGSSAPPTIVIPKIETPRSQQPYGRQAANAGQYARGSQHGGVVQPLRGNQNAQQRQAGVHGTQASQAARSAQASQSQMSGRANNIHNSGEVVLQSQGAHEVIRRPWGNGELPSSQANVTPVGSDRHSGNLNTKKQNGKRGMNSWKRNALGASMVPTDTSFGAGMGLGAQGMRDSYAQGSAASGAPGSGSVGAAQHGAHGAGVGSAGAGGAHNSHNIKTSPDGTLSINIGSHGHVSGADYLTISNDSLVAMGVRGLNQNPPSHHNQHNRMAQASSGNAGGNMNIGIPGQLGQVGMGQGMQSTGIGIGLSQKQPSGTISVQLQTSPQNAMGTRNMQNAGMRGGVNGQGASAGMNQNTNQQDGIGSPILDGKAIEESSIFDGSPVSLAEGLQSADDKHRESRKRRGILLAVVLVIIAVVVTVFGVMQSNSSINASTEQDSNSQAASSSDTSTYGSSASSASGKSSSSSASSSSSSSSSEIQVPENVAGTVLYEYKTKSTNGGVAHTVQEKVSYDSTGKCVLTEMHVEFSDAAEFDLFISNLERDYGNKFTLNEREGEKGVLTIDISGLGLDREEYEDALRYSVDDLTALEK